MYKKVLLLSLLALSVWKTQAQVFQELPNNEFNYWTANNYNPAGWSTIESIFQNDYSQTIKDTADKVNGEASLALVTNSQTGRLTYGFASVGTATYTISPHGINLKGIPYTSRPDTLWVLYKYTTPGTDTAAILLNLYSNPTGAAQVSTLQTYLGILPQAQWTLRAWPLTAKYVNNQAPDSIVFNFLSSATNASRTSGSKFQIDGVYFNAPAGQTTAISNINIPGSDLRIYPNPSGGNNRISLQSMANLKGYQFELHNISGNEVLRTQLENNNTPVNTNSLSAGAYLWLLVDKDGRIVNKGKWIKTN